MKDLQYSVSGLQEAIERLERQQAEAEKQLRSEVSAVYEGLKPVNLLRNTVREFVGTQEMRDLIIRISATVAAGLIVKLLFQEEESTQTKHLVRSAIQLGITSTVSNHPEVLEELGSRIVELFHSDAA